MKIETDGKRITNVKMCCSEMTQHIFRVEGIGVICHPNSDSNPYFKIETETDTIAFRLCPFCGEKLEVVTVDE